MGATDRPRFVKGRGGERIHLTQDVAWAQLLRLALLQEHDQEAPLVGKQAAEGTTAVFRTGLWLG